MKIRPASLPTEALPQKIREAPKPPEGTVDVRVKFSKAARKLAAQVPEDRVDMERVQRLRAQIEAGTYEIDDMALAQALIEKELQWKP